MLGFGRKKSKSARRSSANAGDAPAPGGDPWGDRASLVAFSSVDQWTIGDSFEGVQIFGASGSGKTSGSGTEIARAMLGAGYGGLVLTVKPDETELWRRHCAATGRSDSLVLFGPDHGRGFNFLEYERRRAKGGGSSENIAELLLTIRRITRRSGSAGGGQDPFWDESQQALLRNAVDLLLLADEPVSLPAMEKVILSAPTESVEWEGIPALEGSYCIQCLRKAAAAMESAPADDVRQATLEATAAYWLWKFPPIPEKTKRTISTMFDGTADGFLRGQMRRLFCEQTNIVPELTFEGAVIVLDIPLKRHHDLGRAAQILWKHMWQRAVEARDLSRNRRPVFLWVDEAQHFITARDSDFQGTARSSRASTVYLTQNISSYYAAIGAAMGGDGRIATDAFLGNLQTLIFHANADQATNAWASKYFAKRWRMRTSKTVADDDDDERGDTVSYQDSLDPEVLESRFHNLRRGGPRDQGIVEAIVACGGRPWRASGQPALLAEFYQNRGDVPRA